MADTLTVDDDEWDADDIRNMKRTADQMTIWKRDGDKRIAELEAALCRIAYVHQEIDASGAHEKLGRAQNVAMRAIEHIPHERAQRIAEVHHSSERDAQRMFSR